MNTIDFDMCLRKIDFDLACAKLYNVDVKVEGVYTNNPEVGLGQNAQVCQNEVFQKCRNLPKMLLYAKNAETKPELDKH